MILGSLVQLQVIADQVWYAQELAHISFTMLHKTSLGYQSVTMTQKTASSFGRSPIAYFLGFVLYSFGWWEVADFKNCQFCS